MKKLTFSLIFLGLIASAIAQIPEGFSYQAVIRDNNETLVKNQNVAIKATILRDDAVIFTQIQTVATNDNGLMTLTIGGTPEFSEIDWTHGPLIIKTQIDPTGGDNYTIETTAPLLTVPYSMAAKTAEKALNVPDLDNLLERINNLENQIEELYSLIGGFEPRDVPFSELLDIGECFWSSLSWNEPCNSYKLVVINSQEELMQYVNCADDAELPPIDFDRFSLILAYGVECYTTMPAYDIEVQRTSIRNYVMKVNLYPGAGAALTPWKIPILVDKLQNSSDVELIVTRDTHQWEFEDIEFEEFILDTEMYNWIEFEYEYECWGKGIEIINSYEELMQVLVFDEGTELPTIDFSVYSLMLFHGGYCWGQSNFCQINFHKVTKTLVFGAGVENYYQMHLIWLSTYVPLPQPQRWYFAILVNKLEEIPVRLLQNHISNCEILN